MKVTFQRWIGDRPLQFARLWWVPMVVGEHWHKNVYGMGSWQPIGWSSYVVLPAPQKKGK